MQLSRGPAHDITTLANEASGVMGSGQRRLTAAFKSYFSNDVNNTAQADFIAFALRAGPFPGLGWAL